MNTSLPPQDLNGVKPLRQPPADRNNKKPALRIKSYYARSVEEALGKASEELGSDAILVHSRKTPIESRHLGPYEVVFALSADSGAKSDKSQSLIEKREPPRVPPPPAANATDVPLSIELMQMRRQMEEIRRALAFRSVPAAEEPEPDSPVEAARTRLVAAGVEEDLAVAIVHACASQLRELTPGDESARVSEILRREMARRLPPAPHSKTDAPPIAAFIGPPGVGKTTTLIKLALKWGQNSSLPVHLISTDTYRIGAAEQLRTYASILGAGLDVVDSPALLRQAIEANRPTKRLLIDTPGLSGSDFELLDDLAEFLRGSRDIEKHLLLPATARAADLKRALRLYERFGADRLLFTRLDETGIFGGIYSMSAWSAVPASYLSAGQQIPEDLEAATSDRLADLVLGADTPKW